MVKRAFSVAVGALAVAALGGCGLLVAQLATDFSFSIEPEKVAIAPGGSATLTVRVSQTLPVDVAPLPIEVWLHDAPDGVTADALTIPSGIDEDDLLVHVANGTDPGGPFEVTVRASNEAKTKEATFELTVDAP